MKCMNFTQNNNTRRVAVLYKYGGPFNLSNMIFNNNTGSTLILRSRGTNKFLTIINNDVPGISTEDIYEHCCFFGNICELPENRMINCITDKVVLYNFDRECIFKTMEFTKQKAQPARLILLLLGLLTSE